MDTSLQFPIGVWRARLYVFNNPFIFNLFRVDNGFFGLPFVTWYESLYLYGLVPLYLYTEFGHQLLGFQEKLPFIPLMMTSFYCSIGVIWSWMLLYFDFLLEMDKGDVTKKKDVTTTTTRKNKKKTQ